jgi:aspartyl-tRNA(Asn)/glutamyl-tRNA(Gln) amidotransferase subunit A
VEDAAILLEVVAGNDPLDAITLDRPVPAYSRSVRDSIAKVRIGVPRTNYFENLDSDVAARVEEAIALLRPRVAEVRDINLPAFQPVQGGGTDIELYHYHKPFFDTSAKDYQPYSQRLLERAKEVTAVGYVETLKRIREARRDVRQVFADVDVLLLPTMREPAPSIKEVMDRTHRGRPSNTGVFNRLGLPAITVPCGVSRDHLPIGLQIVGPAFGEPVVVAVAASFERLRGSVFNAPPDS